MKLFTLLLVLFFPVDLLAGPGFYEDAGEYIKIEVQYHNDNTGLIWAYKCHSCLPRRFMFDRRLVVQTDQDKSGPEGLQAVDGKAAVVTWIPNTLQALRVLPMTVE